jgi:tRNA 2-thiouridine synthesizing protein E
MFDEEGFLLDLNNWSETIAQQIATGENITLSEAHWQVLYAAREFHQRFDLSPEMRPLVKWVGENLGKDKGNSIYLLKLFPGSPAKLVSKIAGLPKPLNCL